MGDRLEWSALRPDEKRAHYAHLEALVTKLMTDIADQLPEATVAQLDEWIHDVDEFGVATEVARQVLVEAGNPVGPGTVETMQELVDAMHLDQANVDRLKPLVRQ